MSAQWHSLVSRKLFLALQLARLAESQVQAPDREACLQGAIELALRSRQLLLVLIARYYQHKQASPQTLAELEQLIGDVPEIHELTELTHMPDSWWHHLDQLAASEHAPPRQQKTVSDDNIIAVSAAPGPDRSAASLQASLQAMKQLTGILGERHHEW